MPKTSTKPVDAEEIAEMVDRGQDISAPFQRGTGREHPLACASARACT